MAKSKSPESPDGGKPSFLSRVFRALNPSGAGGPGQPSPAGNEESRPPFALDTIGVEVSYSCNLRCAMCPRRFEVSRQGCMSLEFFREKIAPAIGRIKYVHLTGWGEPLVNSELPEMIRLCVEAGCSTAFTSNGLLLRPPADREVLEAGVDQINISCDASTPETYERVRGKGNFGLLMERLRAFTALCGEFPKRPVLQWAFVMMKSNIAELPDAVRLAASLGFNGFAAKHMESAMTRDGLCEALFNTGAAPDLTPAEEEIFAVALEKAQRAAKETGIRLDVHPRRFAIEETCLVRPLHNLFVDWRGNVSPCCYLIEEDVRPYMAEKPKDSGILGNLNSTPLEELIAGEALDKFQRLWANGEIPESCRGCLQVARMKAKE